MNHSILCLFGKISCILSFIGASSIFFSLLSIFCETNCSIFSNNGAICFCLSDSSLCGGSIFSNISTIGEFCSGLKIISFLCVVSSFFSIICKSNCSILSIYSEFGFILCNYCFFVGSKCSFFSFSDSCLSSGELLVISLISFLFGCVYFSHSIFGGSVCFLEAIIGGSSMSYGLFR